MRDPSGLDHGVSTTANEPRRFTRCLPKARAVAIGYTTDFSGEVYIDPPLNEHEVSFLQDFNRTRRMNRKRGPLFITDVEGYGQSRDHDIIDYNNSDPSQPGLWCQWTPADDGTFLEWDGGEKFYNSAEWMKFIIENLLSEKAKPYLEKHDNEDPRLHYFTANHVLNGKIDAQGEESDDRWVLIVKDNVVMVAESVSTFQDPKPI